MTQLPISRRAFVGAGLGAAAGSLLMPNSLFAAENFPSRNINITIPTGEGGGSDRDGRIFASIWQKYLDTNFEFGFYPGASGQTGYEFYINSREPDAHNLILSFMGAEVVVLTLQAPHIQIGRDIVFIQQINSEPMAVFAGAESPYESLEQLVETARERPVNVAVARLPHASSIGMLALAEQTGAQFNLIPFGGGGPAATAAITGEVDCCALALTTILSAAENARILGIFDNENPVPDRTDAPPVNEVFGTDVPPMLSTRAWAIHAEAIEQYPERVEVLKRTMQQTLNDPEYAAASEEVGVPAQFIAKGGQEETMAIARSLAEQADRYRDLLTEQ